MTYRPMGPGVTYKLNILMYEIYSVRIYTSHVNKQLTYLLITSEKCIWWLNCLVLTKAFVVTKISAQYREFPRNGHWSTVYFILVCQTLLWRFLFYYFLFLADIFMMCVNVFYVTRNEISVRSDKKWEISS